MQLLRIYLIGINILTFVLWGMDKRKAVKGWRRVSEKTLLLLSLVGGRAGGYLAMSLFRHKTLKGTFLWKFRLIVSLWIVGLFLFLIYGTS